MLYAIRNDRLALPIWKTHWEWVEKAPKLLILVVLLCALCLGFFHSQHN